MGIKNWFRRKKTPEANAAPAAPTAPQSPPESQPATSAETEIHGVDIRLALTDLHTDNDQPDTQISATFTSENQDALNALVHAYSTARLNGSTGKIKTTQNADGSIMVSSSLSH